jgi:hypothetical protein
MEQNFAQIAVHRLAKPARIAAQNYSKMRSSAQIVGKPKPCPLNPLQEVCQNQNQLPYQSKPHQDPNHQT